MSPLRSETLPLRTDEDVLRVRQTVRVWMVEQTFNVVEQTMMVTATSELARNTVVYGGGGSARLELLADSGRQGIRVIFEDEGQGIPDIEQALKDGFTTGAGLGLGLGGSKRLVDEFEIESAAGKGTRVTITKWKKSHP
ncbi:MAG: anti-sigma regulatory factor [Methylococcaceae bacterium]